MSPIQVKKFRTMLVKACDEYIERGGKIIAQSFASGTGAMCPIETLLYSSNKTSIGNGGMSKALSDVLGFSITERDIWRFIYGFDGWNSRTLQQLKGQSKNPIVQMARRLRKKYIK